MLRKLIIALAPVALLVTPVMAQDAGPTTEVDLASLDTNADGHVDFMELQAAFPDITEEDFNAWDTNGDGVLDFDELEAARATGGMDAEEGAADDAADDAAPPQ